MRKRFTFMKSMITFIVILLAAFTLVACDGEDQQALIDEAQTQVSLVFASGDSATSVTQNLTLPTTVGDVQITWVSGNAAVISNAGVVTRQAADTNVTLTATLTLGELTATKAFALKVIAAVVVVDPADALDAIMITGYGLVYTATTDRYSTLSNIVLPMTSMDLAITWSSSNAAVLSAEGVAVRPAWNTADSTVILTATIGDETKDFVITVLAITEKPAAIILAEAKDILLLTGVSDGVAADLTLPATVGTEGVTVTWTSSDVAYITDAGVVNRPAEGDETVTLTATLHLGDEMVTKEFEVVVLTFEPYAAVADIAAAIAAQVAADDTVYIEVPDLTVVALWTTGYMLYDGTTMMQVYQTPTEEIVEGAVFTFRGAMQNRYGSLQFFGDANMPIVLTDSDATAAVLTPTVITSSVSDYIATLPAHPLTSPTVYEYVQITAKVQVDDPLLKYETFLVNTDHDGSEINVVDPISFNADAFMIYYPTNIDAVRAYDGLEVTINIFIYGVRTDKMLYYVLFTGEAEDIQTSLDDAGIIDVAKSALTSSFEDSYTVESTIDLPDSLLGIDIVWDSASEYLDLTTGLVTMPTTAGQVEVTLTGSLDRNGVTDTVTITFMVGEIEVMSIASLYDMNADEKIRIQGILSAQTKTTGYWIQDATAGLNVYASGDILTAIQALSLGAEIELFGSLDIYNGLFEITSITAINVVNETPALPTPASLNDVDFTDTALLAYQGQLVSFEGFLLKYDVNASTSSFNVVLYNPITDSQISARVESTVAGFDAIVTYINALDVNAPIDVVGGIIGWYYGYQLAVTGSSNFVDGTLLDGHKVYFDSMDLVIPTEMMEIGTITLPAAGTNLSVIDWTSSNDLLIDPTTGVVALPASGVETVTLTATLTLNDAEYVATFEVVVGVPAEVVIYSTGFEAPDFTAATVYNNATVTYTGPVDFQWGTVYGTPTTTGSAVITGLQAIQMRYYTSAPTVYGYTFTDFVSTDVTKVMFNSFNYSGAMNVEVSISKDGGTTWIQAEIFTLLDEVSTTFTYDLDLENQTGDIMVKFAMVGATVADRVSIDDVEIYSAN